MQKNTCPECGRQTFHLTPTGRKCSGCGYEMTLMAPNGGGKGKRCANCGKHTVVDGKCRSCGATYGF